MEPVVVTGLDFVDLEPTLRTPYRYMSYGLFFADTLPLVVLNTLKIYYMNAVCENRNQKVLKCKQE
jgi:hypothetical protein